MRAYVRAVVVGLWLLGIGTIGMAQAAERFGYVDFQRALNEVSEGRQAKTQLEQTYAQRQRELDKRQTDLEALKQQLEKDRLVLSAEALRAKEDEYRQRFLELTQKLGEFKAELAQQEARVTGEILNALRQIVQAIGAQEGYTMILEKSQDVVLFSPGDADLTSRVIKAYNALPKSKRRLKD